MNRRLWPLELTSVMTFGVLGILTIASGISWKERGRLISENERLQSELLQAQIADSHQLVTVDPADRR